MELRPYQIEARDAVINEWNSGRGKTLLVLPTGCHAIGQKLLLADGSVKAVEDISQNDCLMGVDGKPRQILYIQSGATSLYKIIPTDGGQPFIVTGNHLLTVKKMPSSEYTDIPVYSLFYEFGTRVVYKYKQVRITKYGECLFDYYIEPFGFGAFIGFTVDDDNRYLLADGTLTHNCGKTIVFSSIVQKRCETQRGRALILAHREELLQQASDKLFRLTGIQSAMEKAERHADSNAQVIVGSIQTFAKESRLNSFDPNYFDTIVVDEAHHCLSESYQTVLGHFNAKVVGVTATPDRGDKKDLATFFDSTAYEYSLYQAIKNGYLVPVTALMMPLKINLNGVKVSCGDYVVHDLGDAIEPYLESIAAEMACRIRKRKTVVFLPLVAISQKFCEILNRYGFRAAEINGNSENRAQILSDFEQGKYNVLCNSMLLTEGWDCPSVDCCVVLRPTKSRALYTQMIGRCLRPSPETGKQGALILDFLWLTDKHSLCRPSSIVAKSAEIAKKIDEAIEQGGAVDLLESEEKAEHDVFEERKKALADELNRQRHKKLKLVDPLQYVYSIEDGASADYEPVYEWERQPVSDKQAQTLEKLGINPDTVDCKGRATVLLNILFQRNREHLSTPKQIRLLERYGFQSVGTWGFDEASNMISRISANNWRIPYNEINPSTYRP